VTIKTASCRTELDFLMTGSVKRGDVQAGCTAARTHLEVESDDPPSAVADAVRLAHRGCFIEQLVAKPVPMSSTLTLNGTLLGDDEAEAS
jgi:hypothetical protein